MLWLAIRSLMKVTKRTKAPTWRANCQCFVPSMSKLYCTFGLDGVLEDTRMCTGLGGMSLRPVVAARVTSTKVCSRGYKRAREG
jgi:hypothetical protein